MKIHRLLASNAAAIVLLPNTTSARPASPVLTIGARFMSRLRRVFVTSLLLIVSQDVEGGSATWNLDPIDNNWNNSLNWTPATVPNGPTDVATFENSNTTALSLSAGLEVDRIAFESGASAFTITVPGRAIPIQLQFDGAGVMNDSGVTQNFIAEVTNSGASFISFYNSATAGDLTRFTMEGGNPNAQGSSLAFLDASNAGSSVFVCQGGSGMFTSGGFVTFLGSSSAASATFTCNPGTTQGFGSSVSFQDSASAGTANLTALGGGINGFMGQIYFNGNSNAADATITLGQQVENGPGGSLFVTGTSHAGTSTIACNRGQIGFYDSASADHAAIDLNGGGTLTFISRSSAGHAIVSNHGAPSKVISPNTINFIDTSTAANGTFVTSGGGGRLAYGAFTFFNNTATAANGNFTTNGADVEDAATGGNLWFFNSSSAGDAVFTTNGGTVSRAPGGLVQFFGTTTAANGTFILNGGTNLGKGASLGFLEDSNGGTAHFHVFGNANLDLSAHNAPGTEIGSLDGTGEVFLGANNLSVGGDNHNTTFSGRILDGGVAGGTGGSLTKTGAGTLSLTHRSTYTGGTIITGGTLIVGAAAGSATGAGPVNLSAGTLAGIGTIAGDVTVGSGAGPGAVILPGKSNAKPGLLAISKSLTFLSDGDYGFALDSNSLVAAEILAAGVVINSGAQFSPSDLGNALLPTGSVFTVISNTAASPIGGAFANLPDGSIVVIGSNSYEVDYEGGDGNDLTLTVLP